MKIKIKTILSLLIIIISFHDLFAQHTVKVKVGSQVYTVMGDTTKYNFKSTLAKLEKRFIAAAEYKLKAIKVGENINITNAYYAISTYYCKANAVEKAIKYLGICIDMGYNDLANLEFNKDFINIRKTEQWKRITPSIDNYYKSNSKEIARLYAEDQAPRLPGGGGLTKKVVKEDSIRRTKIKALLKKRKVKSAHDYYKAAMIMHHGVSEKDYKLAHKLATIAFKKKDHHNFAPWLVAASKDRYLLKKGEKMWYATQLVYKNGKPALDPKKIDTTAVSNERRKELNAPSIEKIRDYISAFNSKK